MALRAISHRHRTRSPSVHDCLHSPHPCTSVLALSTILSLVLLTPRALTHTPMTTCVALCIQVPAGSLPRTMDVIMRHEAVETAKAGDKMVFTGQMVVVPDVAALAAPGERVQVKEGECGHGPRAGRGALSRGTAGCGSIPQGGTKSAWSSVCCSVLHTGMLAGFGALLKHTQSVLELLSAG